MTDKMRIWDALCRTDPAQTKPFSRPGGFKGTAVKPIWITKRLTEQFGPCGEGWGVNEPSFQVVTCEGEILVFCTVSCWHESKDKVLWGVGGDKVMVKRNSGSFCDDEAFKKAFTDAIGNAFKFIGVAADVHLGQFNDSKYVNETKAALAKEKRTEQLPVLIDDAQWKALTDLVEKSKASTEWLCSRYGVSSLKEMPLRAFEDAMKGLSARLAKMKTGEE